MPALEVKIAQGVPGRGGLQWACSLVDQGRVIWGAEVQALGGGMCPRREGVWP